jgi:diaminopimelate decarboxylase
MKPRPISDLLLHEAASRFGTPLFLYDTPTLLARLHSLSSFDLTRYAQKANPNLSLLRLLHSHGAHVDAVSCGEIHRALRAGFPPTSIAFTADLFDKPTLDLLSHQSLPVNLGSPDMLEQYAQIHPGGEVTLRINPGFGHGHDAKVTTGGEQSKHGLWHADLPRHLKRARELDLRVSGLHVHTGSGSDLEHLSRTCAAMERFARLTEDLTSISAGGGLPIPYRPDEAPFDLARYADAWLGTKARIERELRRELRLEVEPGRYLVAECGVLLTEVRGTKQSGGLDYVLVDAGFHNLLRPALYGAYHHVSAVGRDGEPTLPQIVAGPLCETGDVFTLDPGGRPEPRELPRVQVGDLLCIHDAGAYGMSMASNYNSQLHAAEVLVEDGTLRLVRRRQTIEELLAPETDSIG